LNMAQNNKLRKKGLRLEGEKIYLIPLRTSHVGPTYLAWLRDKEVNQFLEARFTHYTLASLKKYVSRLSRDQNNLLLAIILKGENRFIGTIKLGFIDWNHSRGDIGIMIGDKSCWGKGYATEAIKLLTNYAFDKLRFHKITAGAYDINKGSIKAFLKLGFYKECHQKEHCIYGRRYIGHVLLAKINEKA